jgi:hypothetical protein
MKQGNNLWHILDDTMEMEISQWTEEISSNFLSPHFTQCNPLPRWPFVAPEIYQIHILGNQKNVNLYRVQQASFLFPSDRSVQKRKLACRTLYNKCYPHYGAHPLKTMRHMEFTLMYAYACECTHKNTHTRAHTWNNNIHKLYHMLNSFSHIQ